MKKEDVWNWLRLITPVLTGLTFLLINMVLGKIDKLDEKIFVHLTNAEIHMPREQILTKAEFDINCKLVEKQQEVVLKAIDKLRDDINSRK